MVFFLRVFFPQLRTPTTSAQHPRPPSFQPSRSPAKADARRPRRRGLAATRSMEPARIVLGCAAGAAGVALGALFLPVAFPVVVDMEEASAEGAQRAEDRVLLAGSFSPPHLGHLAMLRYLSRRHRRVFAVIGVNPSKRAAVPAEVRCAMLRRMLEEEGLENVEAVTYAGYIWRFAIQEGCSVLYRGIRTWERDGRDERALHVLNQVGPVTIGRTLPIPTRFIRALPEFRDVSSTRVRSRVRQGESIDDLIAPGTSARASPKRIPAARR